MTAWLACIAAGRWQTAGVRAAQQAGLRVLAIDGDPDAEGFSLADRSVVADIRQPDEVLAVITATGLSLAGVTTFTAEVSMLAAAHVREAWSLPGPGLSLTTSLIDKAVQRRVLDAADDLNPTWLRVTSEAEADLALARVGVPMVVKPVDSAGSRGVARVDAADDLAAAIRAALSFSPSGAAICEGWIPGVEHTVEAFGDGHRMHVLAVTRKRRSSSAAMVADELLALPATDPDRGPVERAALAALDQLGHREGLAHVEVIHDRVTGQTRIVEAAGRGGGFHVAESLVPLVSGVDVLSLAAAVAVGHAVTVPTPLGGAACLRFLPTVAGVFTGLDGMDEVRELGVQVGELAVRGQSYGAAASDGDRAAYVLCAGPDVESTERLVKLAVSKLTVGFDGPQATGASA